MEKMKREGFFIVMKGETFLKTACVEFVCLFVCLVFWYNTIGLRK